MPFSNAMNQVAVSSFLLAPFAMVMKPIYEYINGIAIESNYAFHSGGISVHANARIAVSTNAADMWCETTRACIHEAHDFDGDPGQSRHAELDIHTSA